MTLEETITENHKTFHTNSCRCQCPACVQEHCKTFKPTLSSFMKHSLCAASESLVGSSLLFHKSACLRLTCNVCWLNRPDHILHCPLSNWTSLQGLQIISSCFQFELCNKIILPFFRHHFLDQL